MWIDASNAEFGKPALRALHCCSEQGRQSLAALQKWHAEQTQLPCQLARITCFHGGLIASNCAGSVDILRALPLIWYTSHI